MMMVLRLKWVLSCKEAFAGNRCEALSKELKAELEVTQQGQACKAFKAS